MNLSLPFRRRFLRACACTVLLATGASAPAQTAPAPLEGRALVAALRHGGYVLYMRHTATDFGESDERMTSFEDCTRQRNLTDQGRADARAIGAAIRELGLPIATVYASPYCRTRETAQLVFGTFRVSPAVRGGPARPESPDRYAELRQLLSTHPSAGTNVAIASHGNPFRAVTDAPYLAEGEIAVVEPQGSDRFRIAARITKDAWAALVRAAP